MQTPAQAEQQQAAHLLHSPGSRGEGGRGQQVTRLLARLLPGHLLHERRDVKQKRDWGIYISSLNHPVSSATPGRWRRHAAATAPTSADADSTRRMRNAVCRGSGYGLPSVSHSRPAEPGHSGSVDTCTLRQAVSCAEPWCCQVPQQYMQVHAWWLSLLCWHAPPGREPLLPMSPKAPSRGRIPSWPRPRGIQPQTHPYRKNALLACAPGVRWGGSCVSASMTLCRRSRIRAP